MLASAPLHFADVLLLSEIALIIFIVVFLGIVMWVFVLRRKNYQKESRIPLEDDRIMTPRDDDDDADESQPATDN